MDDIKYKWGDGLKNASALDISPDIELPQLKYKDSRLIEREFRFSTGLYSRLTMKLYFVRSLGYYIIQIYIPSTLIVVLSWVSFWLDISAAPARITLGMTTVLTMVTFIWSTNASLPKISYIKGIDVYLVTCFVMTFSSVIEYAVVAFIYNRTERKKKEAAAKSAAGTAATNASLSSPPSQSQQIVVMQSNIKKGLNSNSLRFDNLRN
jgi:gamma-aminobutyric acid receptor subunit beta